MNHRGDLLTMPHKDPTTWSALEWSIALLVATFSGMARVIRDVAERKSVGLWLITSRLSGSIVGGMTLGATAAGIGLPPMLQYVGASWGGILGLAVFDLIAETLKRRLGQDP
jgi:hypothetical protein